MWTALAVGAIACSGETTAPPTADAALGVANGTGGGGTDTSGTSTGPVANVTVGPKQVTMHVGHYTLFTATPRDANGKYVTGKKATWQSSNTAVLVASDSGIFYGKAIGSAKVYGTIDGKVDSASVVVTATPPDTTTRPDSVIPPPPPPPPAVSAFNLTITVSGAVAGSDTLRTELVAGATIKVTRVQAINGDTLNPSVVAATLTTDANGVASVANLPGGYYTFVATPPAGSSYLVSNFAIGAPTISDVQVRIVLRRAP